MNFNIKNESKTNKGKKNTTLSFGLNTRRKNKKSLSSVLLQDDGESSSSEEGNGNYNKQNSISSSSRKNVNREIAAEQEALRKRAEKAIAEISSPSGATTATKAGSNIYDYDAEYESFSSDVHHQQKLKAIQDEKNNNKNNKPKESRYIANLMEKAKERKQEREIIFERKIAREQEAEGINNDEYLGKDKFVTKAYKRVLEERQSWMERDKKQTKIEEEEDVTKRKGMGVMGLYSNFDAAVGGNLEGKKSIGTSHKSLKNYGSDSQDNTNKVYKSDNEGEVTCKYDNLTEEDGNEYYDKDAESIDGIDEELKEQASRAERLLKIFSARDRYLERLKAGTVFQ